MLEVCMSLCFCKQYRIRKKREGLSLNGVRAAASSRGKGPPVMRTPPASRRPRSGRPVSDTSGELWADPQIFPGRGLRASRPLL